VSRERLPSGGDRSGASRPRRRETNAPASDVPVVVVDDLTRRFGDTVALDSISLRVPRGSVFGLVGENGAGKTTLLRHILGFLRPQSGKVAVFGLDPVCAPATVLSRIGYLSEDRDVPTWMTASQLLAYLRPFYEDWDMDLASDLCRQFELPFDQNIATFSMGQRVRIAIVCALAYRPDLLILDEPSTGLDPVVRRDLLAAIARIVEAPDRTVVFSSHLLDEVESVATNIAMLHRGRMVLQDSLKSIMEAHIGLDVSFDEPHEELPDIRGAMASGGSGTQWSIIWRGTLGEEDSAITAARGTIVDRRPVSLEDIFVARANTTDSSSEG